MRVAPISIALLVFLSAPLAMGETEDSPSVLVTTGGEFFCYNGTAFDSLAVTAPTDFEAKMGSRFAFHPNGQVIASTNNTAGSIWIWNGTHIQEATNGWGAPARNLAWHPTAEFLAFVPQTAAEQAGDPLNVDIWQWDPILKTMTNVTGQPVTGIETGNEDSNAEVAWSPAGDYLVARISVQFPDQDDGELILYSFDDSSGMLTEEDRYSTTLYDAGTTPVFHPSLNYFVMVFDDEFSGGENVLTTFSITGNAIINEFEFPDAGPWTDLAFDPEGDLLAVTNTTADEVVLFEFETADGSFTILDSEAPAVIRSAITWNPLGTLVAVGGGATSSFFTAYNTTAETLVSEATQATSGTVTRLVWVDYPGEAQCGEASEFVPPPQATSGCLPLFPDNCQDAADSLLIDLDNFNALLGWLIAAVIAAGVFTATRSPAMGLLGGTAGVVIATAWGAFPFWLAALAVAATIAVMIRGGRT